MNRFIHALLVLAAFIMIGCGPNKKVLVMTSGKVTIADNVITLEPGNTHQEKEMVVSADKLVVTTPSGSTDFPVSENGFYILNLKTDTLVGSFQRIGTELSESAITQDDLKSKIDSLNLLMTGKNTGGTNRNFCIAPNQLTRISNNTEAEVVGPYRKMPQSFTAGKDHEVYKVYTNKEMMEIVERLKPMVDTTSGKQ